MEELRAAAARAAAEAEELRGELEAAKAKLLQGKMDDFMSRKSAS